MPNDDLLKITNVPRFDFDKLKKCMIKDRFLRVIHRGETFDCMFHHESSPDCFIVVALSTKDNGQHLIPITTKNVISGEYRLYSYNMEEFPTEKIICGSLDSLIWNMDLIHIGFPYMIHIPDNILYGLLTEVYKDRLRFIVIRKTLVSKVYEPEPYWVSAQDLYTHKIFVDPLVKNVTMTNGDDANA